MLEVISMNNKYSTLPAQEINRLIALFKYVALFAREYLACIKINKAHLVGIWYFFLCLFILGMVSGCSSMSPVTEQDKIDSIVVPEGVIINYMDRYELQRLTGERICGRSDWTTFKGICVINTTPVYKVVMHEIRHCIEKDWHGDQNHAEAC